MATVKILNAGEQPLHQSWRMTAVVSDNAGEPVGGAAVTVAIWNPSSNLWWSAADSVWSLVREDIALTASTTAGFHTLDLDPAMMVGGEVDLALVVASDMTSSVTDVLRWRYDLLHAPVTLGVIPPTITTVGQLLSVMALWNTCSVKVDDSAKQLVVYLADGVTPALVFDLKDATGLPSAMEPFQRVRA